MRSHICAERLSVYGHYMFEYTEYFDRNLHIACVCVCALARAIESALIVSFLSLVNDMRRCCVCLNNAQCLRWRIL